MSKYAVIDVETTGFGKSDRVVEIGVVVIDANSGEVVDEFDTLINPLRDVGPTHVHGITASMVETAPTFEEVSGALARVIGGNVIVAHNLPFDQRFLLQEFSRADIAVDAGSGVCTLKLSGEKLILACDRYGITIDHHHRALSDARATAQLLSRLDAPLTTTAFTFGTDLAPGIPRTLRRDSVGGAAMPVSPSRFRVRYPTSDELSMSYLHVLDAYLDDLVLEESERASLNDLAGLYGLDEVKRQGLHEAYIESLIAAARRDGIVTAAEHRLIDAVCLALGVDPSVVPEPSAAVTAPSDLDGLRVCFTGEAIVAGVVMKRDRLESIAANFGMQPVSGVSKKGCDLLVAADPSTASGKAQKARDYGIPIIDIREFMNRIDSSHAK